MTIMSVLISEIRPEIFDAVFAKNGLTLAQNITLIGIYIADVLERDLDNTRTAM